MVRLLFVGERQLRDCPVTVCTRLSPFFHMRKEFDNNTAFFISTVLEIHKILKDFAQIQLCKESDNEASNLTVFLHSADITLCLW